MLYELETLNLTLLLQKRRKSVDTIQNLHILRSVRQQTFVIWLFAKVQIKNSFRNNLAPRLAVLTFGRILVLA